MKVLVSYAVPRLIRHPKLRDRIFSCWFFNEPFTEAWVDEIRGRLFTIEKRNCVILSITKLDTP